MVEAVTNVEALPTNAATTRTARTTSNISTMNQWRKRALNCSRAVRTVLHNLPVFHPCFPPSQVTSVVEAVKNVVALHTNGVATKTVLTTSSIESRTIGHRMGVHGPTYIYHFALKARYPSCIKDWEDHYFFSFWLSFLVHPSLSFPPSLLIPSSLPPLPNIFPLSSYSIPTLSSSHAPFLHLTMIVTCVIIELNWIDYNE